MKKSVLIAILWLTFVGGKALARNTWSNGELSLKNGVVLTGELEYNWKAEIVQFREGNAIKAYSAFQVKEFKYFDDRLNTLRKFITVDYPIKESVHTPRFMEEFGIGSLMIYRRLRHARDPLKLNNASNAGIDDKLIRNINNFTYYVLEGDSLSKLDDFFRELWPNREQEFAREMQQYEATLAADFTSGTLAKLLLITHYNQLKAQASWTKQAKTPVQTDAD